MKLADVITNPVRMKIMQFLQSSGDATTRQISEALPDVPSPTLYRHINYLLKAEVLTVKEERKVRGSLERLLAFNSDRLTENASLDDIAYQFLMALYGSFQRYSERKDADPYRDMLSLRSCMLTLTDESFANFFKEFREVIEKYSIPEDGGKIRSISVISAPITEEEKK